MPSEQTDFQLLSRDNNSRKMTLPVPSFPVQLDSGNRSLTKTGVVILFKIKRHGNISLAVNLSLCIKLCKFS